MSLIFFSVLKIPSIFIFFALQIIYHALISFHVKALFFLIIYILYFQPLFFMLFIFVILESF